MSRRAWLTGWFLVALGVSVFAYKIVGLGTPIAPSNPADLWQVELSVSARGNAERGSLRAALPGTDAGQIIYDERSSSDGLTFTIRTQGGERTGIWSGELDGVHRVVYGFRVKLTRDVLDWDALRPAPVPPELKTAFLGDSLDYPASDPDIHEHLARLSLPGDSDPAGQLRALQAFVAEEIATVPTASRDALLTLAQGEGSELGKARLLTTLLRATGIPARLSSALRLREAGSADVEPFVEAHVSGRWLALSPRGEFLGERPSDIVVLRSGERELVESTSTSALGHQFRARRERLRPEELAAMMVPETSLLGALSLYRLPLATQESLRLLLLLPLGALLASLWRNLVGITTFGTFLPVLLALSFRGTSLWLGLILIFTVLGVGIVGRMWVDRLRLLVVPRLSILLCLVVLTMTALALLGEHLSAHELFAGMLFPVVILTLLIERFSLTLAEEGPRQAMTQTAYTLGVAVGILPLFKSELVHHLLFGFPELVFSIMGLLTFLGGYTGYRLTDLMRFRALGTQRQEGGR